MARAHYQRRRTWLLRMMRDPTLSLGVRAVGAYLAEGFMNAETERAWPSHETLAVHLGVTRKTVQRAISRLIKAGWLCVTPPGRHRTNTYRLSHPEAEETTQTRDRTGTGETTARGHSRPPNQMTEPRDKDAETPLRATAPSNKRFGGMEPIEDVLAGLRKKSAQEKRW